VLVTAPGRDDLAFDRTFVAGAEAACDVRLAGPAVAGRHVEIAWDGVLWWIRSLDLKAGITVDGLPVSVRPLRDRAVVRLGAEGPELHLEVVSGARAARGEAAATPVPAAAPASRVQASRSPARPAAPPAAPATETQLLKRFMRPMAPGQKAGPETAMFLKAVARASEGSTRRSRVAIAVAAVALVAVLAAGAVIMVQQRRAAAVEASAEALFYTARSLQLDIGRLSDAALKDGDPRRAAELAAARVRFGKMERDYDAFVRDLGVYTRAPPDEQAIRTLARRLGECDLNVPGSFIEEVRRYVERWRAGNRLQGFLEKAHRKGFAPGIVRTLEANGLPPQLVYLPMQESGYEERAVGPATRSGYAKGLWQFVPATAHHFGLRVGPRFEAPEFDPQDERFDWQKATGAAARYLHELHQLEAQGSTILAMASYNWGEDSVKKLVASTPATPSERNFWRLLQRREVPRETYDYVLSIFSAALMCEYPEVFHFGGACLYVPKGGEGAP
jgi:hypothetical protein